MDRVMSCCSTIYTVEYIDVQKLGWSVNIRDTLCTFNKRICKLWLKFVSECILGFHFMPATFHNTKIIVMYSILFFLCKFTYELDGYGNANICLFDFFVMWFIICNYYSTTFLLFWLNCLSKKQLTLVDSEPYKDIFTEKVFTLI